MSAEQLPVYKVGLVALRPGGEVLLVQPEPDPAKANYNPASEPPFVLPRGSRRAGAEDIRSDKAARAHAEADFEPLHETLLREAEEEAGVPPAALRAGKLYELGTRDYRSNPHGEPVKVHWYVLDADEAAVKQFHPRPVEARAVRWVNIGQMCALADEGKARAGYIKVVEEAMAALKNGTLKAVTLPL